MAPKTLSLAVTLTKTDPANREELERFAKEVNAIRAAAGSDHAIAPECLSELEIAEVAEGADVSGRADALTHLAKCEVCRRRLAAVASLVTTASIAAEIKRLEQGTAAQRLRTGRFKYWPAAAGLAAAAIAILLLVPRGPETGGDSFVGDEHRSGEITVTALPPRLISPVGMVDTADFFRWTSVPRADRYSLTVFDSDGNLVLQTHATDTVLTIPERLVHRRGATYVWKVEARVDFDRAIGSEMMEFTIRGTRRAQ